MTDTGTPPSDSLRAFLSERDAPCPCCGYNLRALPGSRCPECNQELTLQVGLVHPKLAWFITGLIGIGMSTGFCALLLAWAAFMIFGRGRGGGPRFYELVPVIAGTLAGAITMAAWVRLRPTLTPKEPALRWALAAGVTAFCLAFPLWFFAVVR